MEYFAVSNTKVLELIPSFNYGKLKGEGVKKFLMNLIQVLLNDHCINKVNFVLLKYTKEQKNY